MNPQDHRLHGFGDPDGQIREVLYMEQAALLMNVWHLWLAAPP